MKKLYRETVIGIPILLIFLVALNLLHDFFVFCMTSRFELIQTFGVQANQVVNGLTIVGILLLVLVFLSASVTATRFVVREDVQSLWLSLSKTFMLHQFLRRTVTNNAGQETMRIKDLRKFNRISARSYITVRKGSLEVVVYYARSQQLQKILFDMTSQLRDQIASEFPGFYFSNAERTARFMTIKGHTRGKIW